MCLTEYDEARTMALFKKEAKTEGIKEGRKEERISLLTSLVRKGLLSETNAAEEAHMTLQEFKKQMDLSASSL